MKGTHKSQTNIQGERLDRFYRLQRHFYDLTRWFFLFGRNSLLERMEIDEGDRVLEIGCGTGRNLLMLSRLYPKTKFYGLDASKEMLKTASAKMDAHDLTKQVVLRHDFAEQFSAKGTFALDEPFDSIFFSYTLSMIPDWSAAIDNAVRNLKPEGKLYILDFGDGRGLPRWFYRLMITWLGLFKVNPHPEMIEYLELHTDDKGSLKVCPVWRYYAFIATFRRF